MNQKLEFRNDAESEEKIYASKSKEETLEYMVTHFKWKRSEITQDAFGALVQKSSIDHFSKIDKGILKVLKGKEATINFEKDIGLTEIEHRLITGFNTLVNKHPSFIQEVYANNKGLGYLKIYPLSDTEDVVVAKRTNKKKLIQRGIMMFRIVKQTNSVLIVPEQRAFKRREFEQVFETLESLGVEMYKVYGDKFAVEDDKN